MTQELKCLIDKSQASRRALWLKHHEAMQGGHFTAARKVEVALGLKAKNPPMPEEVKVLLRERNELKCA